MKKKLIYFLLILSFIFILNLIHVYSIYCPVCTGNWNTYEYSKCNADTDYDYKTRYTRVHYCECCLGTAATNYDDCDVKGSCWGCPPTGGVCDNGPDCTESGSKLSATTTKIRYCKGTSCTVACSPNSDSGCYSSCSSASACASGETPVIKYESASAVTYDNAQTACNNLRDGNRIVNSFFVEADDSNWNAITSSLSSGNYWLTNKVKPGATDFTKTHWCTGETRERKKGCIVKIDFPTSGSHCLEDLPKTNVAKVTCEIAECPHYCGDGICSSWENCNNCAIDCSSTEICDGKDNDCDGSVDENLNEVCKVCNGVFGFYTPADDSSCGIIDCDGRNYYSILGTNSATGTSYCRYTDYDDITTNRCEGSGAYGNCKDANTADCTFYSTSTTVTAGVCEYISGCSGTTPGTLAYYASGTPCGTNLICDGAGNCVSACISHDHKECYNGDSYWYDSCGVREDLADSCACSCSASTGTCNDPSNLGNSCGADDCVNAGTISCSGTCTGTSLKTPGTVCDVTGACNYAGVCTQDIGLRIYDGTSIVKIATEPFGTVTSDFRIYKNSRIHGILLVDVTNAYATNFHILTKNGVKALERYTR